MERLKNIAYYGSLALLIYMPFHILLSQWLSTFTGGLEIWKIAKDVVTMTLVLLSVGLVLWTKVFKDTPYLKFIFLALLYLVLHIGLYFLNRDTSIEVSALASVYNNRLLWFLIIGISAVLLVPKQINLSQITKLVLIISTITCLIGLAQYLLPKDLMEQFGYSVERGVKPAFFIDDKPDLPRVMSTIRDPNSYGAFLIIPLTLLWSFLIDKKHKNKRMLVAGLFVLHSLALFLTFSRSAWAGALISLVVVTILTQREQIKIWVKRLWPIAVPIVLLLFSGGYLLRDQYIVQNIIFHSDETTQAEQDSNDLHLAFAQNGAEDVIEKPFGHGPGTAGIVSIQNEEKGLLTENYYIQIGHEVGIIGLGVFIFILALVIKYLRTSTKTGAALFAAICGYIFMGFLMHLWTNEAVAAYWWLLVGLLVGVEFRKTQKSS